MSNKIFVIYKDNSDNFRTLYVPVYQDIMTIIKQNKIVKNVTINVQNVQTI